MIDHHQGLAQGLLGKRFSHKAWVGYIRSMMLSLADVYLKVELYARAKVRMQVNVVGREHRVKAATLIGL